MNGSREKEIIALFTPDRISSSLLGGIGDDAAVVRSAESRVFLLTVDHLVEGVHFDDCFTPELIGQKALYAGIADIAAMGGTPRFFLLALGIPSTVQNAYLARLSSSIHEAAGRFGIELIGGNTTRAAKLNLSVTVCGEGNEHQIIYRSGAKAGEDLYVTGRLGHTLHLFEALHREASDASGYNTPSLPQPVPRFARRLAQRGNVTAMIDISDGLAQDLHNLSEASQVGVLLDAGAIPVAEDERSDFLDRAIASGEEYQLLFAAPKGEEPSIQALAEREAVLVTRIGETKPLSHGVQMQRGESTAPLLPAGFAHF